MTDNAGEQNVIRPCACGDFQSGHTKRQVYALHYDDTNNVRRCWMQRPCAAASLCLQSLGDPAAVEWHTELVFEFATEGRWHDCADRSQSIGDTMVQSIRLQIGCHLCLVHYPRETRRRRKCAAVSNIFGMAQRSAAPSVTESLVSSATTPVELPSVQGSALIASRPAGRLTADGYAGFKPPDNGCSESHGQERLAVIGRSEQ